MKSPAVLLALVSAAAIAASACEAISGLTDGLTCVDAPCASSSGGGHGGNSSENASTGTNGAGGHADHCSDGKRNEGETDVDCGGGDCPPCGNGKGCETGADCESLSCPAGTCVAPKCDDGVRNGDETDVDCGGATCPGCANNKECLEGRDCVSRTCSAGVCAPWAAAISAGYQHTCAVTSAGGAVCWGRNYNGQLGNGAQGAGTDNDVPVAVSGLAAGVTAISAGGSHSCALTSAGAVFCWGSNAEGQLGNGSSGAGTDSAVPVPVSGLSSGVASIATGLNHACAVTTAGTAVCWGQNTDGRLGNGSSGAGSDSDVPVDVSGLASGVAGIAAGFVHTCAVTTDGGARCWGGNSFGQLGDGSTTNRSLPVVVSLPPVAAISGGAEHTCARLPSVGIKCWGRNVNGELGDGSGSQQSSLPVMVAGLAGAGQVSAGGNHTCAVKAPTAMCWGRNLDGELGNGMLGVSSPVPVDVVNLPSVGFISSGGDHTCALTKEGDAMCWGQNIYGQLGDGTMTTHDTPGKVVQTPTP